MVGSVSTGDAIRCWSVVEAGRWAPQYVHSPSVSGSTEYCLGHALPFRPCKAPISCHRVEGNNLLSIDIKNNVSDLGCYGLRVRRRKIYTWVEWQRRHKRGFPGEGRRNKTKKWKWEMCDNERTANEEFTESKGRRTVFLLSLPPSPPLLPSLLAFSNQPISFTSPAIGCGRWFISIFWLHVL